MEELGRALCIITGASRGFGRTIAKEVSRVVKPGSVFVLVARSGDDLRALQKEMAESDLVVRVVVADLSSMEAVENVTRTAKEAFQEDIQHVILFNNAGCLGDVSRYSSSFTSMAEVNAYLSFNVSSALCLTANVLQAFPKQPGLRRCVVNISSLCALKPFPSWVLYCTGKAARDMMFKVLAEENPDLRVLNYAPGPLDTDMQLVIRTQTAEVTIRQTFADMSAQGQLLTCEASCAKLIKLLQEDKYKSGDHIDVYDV
ncbi:sepiapterin reductase a isoform X1 [Nerophis lumbriciformis]|uniref:sepiapterin reductase a isoform X1 n=1 Tax=Nerophis lumbriciformis TaxID=546530 RepID=UPI002ADF7835|nr:sepiapterin reductase-like isoform X1 [Nerophis lumbriciformis]